jgi:CRP-like cAMP-binding protein
MKELFDEFGACMIGEHSVFSFLCGENMEELAKYFEHKYMKKGDILWEEGDPSEYVAIICSGRVELKKETDFKGKHAVVGIYGRGAVAGALGILDNRPRAVTAIALEKISLMVITKEKFAKMVEENPDLGIKFLKGMLLSVSMRLRKSFEF